MNTHKGEGFFIFHTSGQEDVCIGIYLRNQGLKLPLLSYRYQPCRDWWKMPCMFLIVGCQCQLKGCLASLDIYLASDLTLCSDQLVLSSAYPQSSFPAKIFNPKGDW